NGCQNANLWRVFFGYIHVEKGGGELQAVLEGRPFSWYNRLQRTIKKDWVTLKSKSLHQYNEDSNPIMAAVDELKLIKKEKCQL
ncbi:hypothetical protein BC941DRAFT_412657, partial [Chlamydoabsidia padenii]